MIYGDPIGDAIKTMFAVGVAFGLVVGVSVFAVFCLLF